MARDVIVFLDLEETLIDNWWVGRNLLLDKIEKVKRYIDHQAFGLKRNVKVGLMSWAVHDKKDRQIFVEELQPHIEKLLGMDFDNSYILTMDDWSLLVFQLTGLRTSREDLFEICKKEEILFMLIRKSTFFKNMSVMLIDDAVVGFDMTVVSNNADLRVINIDTLP